MFGVVKALHLINVPTWAAERISCIDLILHSLPQASDWMFCCIWFGFCLKWHCDFAPQIPELTYMPTLKYEGKTCYKMSFTHTIALLV